MAASREEARQRLNILMGTLRNEGIINAEFTMAYRMKKNEDSVFFRDLVNGFLNKSIETMADIKHALQNPDVGFKELNELMFKMKGSSLSIGTEGIANAVGTLSQAIDDKSREGCLTALERIRAEYMTFRNRMEQVLLLETCIIVDP